LEFLRGIDRLFLTFADDGHVVAIADHFDESREAPNGRFVDADERGAGNRRLHVTRVDHARQLHVDRPLLRAIHFGREVVPLWRLSDDLQILDGLHFRNTRRRVDVGTGERDVKLLAADQLAVADAFGRVGFHRDDGAADGERFDRYAKLR